MMTQDQMREIKKVKKKLWIAVDSKKNKNFNSVLDTTYAYESKEEVLNRSYFMEKANIIEIEIEIEDE